MTKPKHTGLFQIAIMLIAYIFFGIVATAEPVFLWSDFAAHSLTGVSVKNFSETKIQDTILPQKNLVIECPEDISTFTGKYDCTANISSGLNINVLQGNLTGLSWVMAGATNDASPVSGIHQIKNYVFNVGTSVITYTASNNADVITCTCKITVVDNEPPVVTAPNDLIIRCNERIPSPHTTLQAFLNAGGKASDNCGLLAASFEMSKEVRDNRNCPYTLTRTYQVADINGNVSMVKQRIIVTDEDGRSYESQESVSGTIATASITKNDISCRDDKNGSVQLNVNGASDALSYFWSTQNGSGIIQGQKDQQNLSAGDYNVNVYKDGVFLMKLEVSILVTDFEPPVILAPDDITINCIENIPAAYTIWLQFERAGGSASDNCRLNYRSFRLYSETKSSQFCPYTITRTYCITDEYGNMSKAEQRIFVEGEETVAVQQPVLKSGMDIQYASSQTFGTSGTFIAPAGVTSITVQAWGGGGKGGSTQNSNTETGGGGGGAFSQSTLTVIPGNSYTVQVGIGSTTTAPGGDSYFNNVTTLLAKGGNSVANNTAAGATGGNATAGVGSIKYSGGNGANGNFNSYGGGGGSSAGTGNNGTTATIQLGAIAPAGGGNGGNGRSGTSGNGNTGVSPGGGGGGVLSPINGNFTGGSGANGLVIISYECPDYVLSGINVTNTCVNDGTSIVTLTSTAAGLPVGSYIVTYNRSLPAASGLTVPISVSTAGTATFSISGLTIAGNSSITIINLSSGTCSSPISINNAATAVVFPLPTATISGTTAICSGSTATISVALTGTQPWNITYTDGVTPVTVTGITATPYTFNVALTSAKTYTVTSVTDANCTNIGTGSADISVYSLPTATINGSADVCQNDPSPSITFTGANGTAPYIFYYTINGGPEQSVTTMAGNAVNIDVPTGTDGIYNYALTRISDSHGCSQNQSGNAEVTVYELPVITAQPQTVRDCEDRVVNFEVTVSGAVTSYTWQRKKPSEGSFSDIPAGETGISYPAPGEIRIENVGGNNNPHLSQYRVIVSNGPCSVTSSEATLEVNEITNLTPTSTNVTQCYGTNYSYTVSTTYPALSYQWRKYDGSSWNNIPEGGAYFGTQTATLNINGGTPAESGSYRVYMTFDATGADCNVNSSTRTRQLTFLPELIPPTVSANQSVCSGNIPAQLIATSASGGSGTTYTYQWEISTDNTNWNLIAGATNLTYQPPALISSTYYRIKATDDASAYNCGTVSSNPILITVQSLPNVSATPPSQTICPGTAIAQINISDLNNIPGTTFTWTRNQTGVLTGIPASGSGNTINGTLNSTIPGTLVTTTFTITATTPAGCKDIKTITVTVGDNTPPTISCAGNISDFTDGASCSKTITTTDPTVNDNCQLSKLTWTMTGATSASSPASGINMVGTYSFNSGITTVTYTATDAGGRTATCFYTVTITDNVAPVITCPGDKTLNNLSGFCYATAAMVSPGTATATDNCNPNPTVTGVRSDALPLNANFPVGMTTITWTASDGSNTSSCIQTITVVDNQPPTFIAPANITVYTDASCSVNILPAITGNVTGKLDNCTPSVSLITNYTDGPIIPGSCIGNYTFDRTWTVTDAAGNIASKIQIISISDNVKPIITIPPNISIKCNESINPNINSALGKATATDNCTPVGLITISYSDAVDLGVCDTRYTINRTWKATDACGNERTGIQVINVSDTEGPVVTMPDLNVPCPSDIPDAYLTIADFEADGGTAIDGCGAVTITILFSNEISNGLEDKPGYCPDNVERTYRFTDPCGNFVDVIQTIYVDDECGCSPCDDNTTFGWVDFLGDPYGSISFYDVERYGKCCADDAWWSEPGAKNLRCVSYNVRIDEDAVGVQIWFEHGASPDVKDWRVDCEEVPLQPGNIICLPSGGYHLFTYCKQGANDNVITFNSVPGIIMSDDLTTRIDCQGQINTEGNFTNPQWTSISPGATGTYNQYLYNPLTPSVPGSGVNVSDPLFIPDDNSPSEIKYQVCADLGTSVCNQFGASCDTITVYVKERIEIDLNISTELICINDPLDLIANVNPASSYYTWSWHIGTGATGPIISTSNTVHFAPPVALGWYSVKVVDHDPTGLMCNTAVYDFQIEADLTGAFVLAPPSGDLIIECNSPGAAQQIQDWLATATATDDEGTPLSVTNDYSGIVMACGTVLPVNFYAIDDCDNEGTATAYINVVDNTPPIIAPATDGTSDCTTLDPNSDPGYIDWLANHGGATATDECDDNLVWTDNRAIQSWSGDPANNQITITFTATDDCGNSNQTTATYSIIDDEPPTITCPPSIEETASLNNCDKSLVTPSDPIISDNCSVPALTYELSGATTTSSPVPGTVTGVTFNVGVTTVTYTVTDAAGLTASCPFDVTIIDINPPVFTLECPLIDITADADPGLCTAALNIPIPEVTDICNELISLTHNSVYGNSPADASGNYPVGTTTFTWTAVDASGNIATCEQSVIVTDTQPPTITCPANVEDLITNGGCDLVSEAIGEPTYGDNCPNPQLNYDIVYPDGSTANGSGSISSLTFPVGQSTVTYTVVDGAGLTADCTFTIWIKNLDAPQFEVDCDAAIDVAADATLGNCEAPVTVPSPGIINPCNEVYTMVNDYNGTNNADDIYPVGTTTITWTITDASGTVYTCSQDVVVTDTQPPTITCPANVEDLITNGGCDLVSEAIGEPTYGDNCPNPQLNYDIVYPDGSTANGSGSISSLTFPVGQSTVTYTVVDGAGLTADCTFTIWIKNLDAPQFEVDCDAAVDVSVNADPGLCGADVSPVPPGIINPCNEVYSIINDFNGTSDATGFYPIGITDVTWTITDASGTIYTCVQQVEVIDEPPTITCPGPYVFDADYEVPYKENISLDPPVWGDNCPNPILDWTLVPPVGYESYYTSADLAGTGEYPNPRTFYVGVTIITYTVTDSNGNPASCDFTVTVRAKPDIECPPTYETNTDPGVCTATLNSTDHYGLPTLVQGVQPIIWTWSITNPDGSSGPSGNFNGSVSDPGPPDISNYPFELGESVINWRAENISGFDECFYLVIVNDEEPPTFTSAPITNCVDMLYSVVVTDGPSNIFNRENLIINPNPDVYTFEAGNTSLDITNLQDNCCDVASMLGNIHWRIDFAPTPDPTGPAGTMLDNGFIEGTGQPSTYGEILFSGDGVDFNPITHTITYWVEDCNGNISLTHTEDIIITPRPKITKIW